MCYRAPSAAVLGQSALDAISLLSSFSFMVSDTCSADLRSHVCMCSAWSLVACFLCVELLMVLQWDACMKDVHDANTNYTGFT